MYADVDETYPGEALEFQAELRASAAAAAQTASSMSASASNPLAASNIAYRAGPSSTAQQPAGAARSPHARSVSPKPSTYIPAAFPAPPGATKQFLLLCVDAYPLPRFGQVELIENCNDNVFFQEMRHAYEVLCSRRVVHYADGTPRWVLNAVELSHSLSDRIHSGLVKLLEFLHMRWLVRSVGGSIFYTPRTANFVKESVIFPLAQQTSHFPPHPSPPFASTPKRKRSAAAYSITVRN